MIRFFSTAMLCITCARTYAQDPCGDPNTIGLLRIGKNFTEPCDSLYFLSKPKYFALQGELKYYKDLNDLSEKLSRELERTISYMDSLKTVQDGFIGRQDAAIGQYRTQIERSDSLIVRPANNTDRTLDELKKSRMRMWLCPDCPP